MSRGVTARLGVLVLLLAGQGCSHGEDIQRSSRDIFFGEPDTLASHMAVVALTYGPGTAYYCTGTLISSHVVLTAAHCLLGDVATDIQLFFGHDAYEEDGSYRQGQALLVHDGYDPIELTADIGLVRLAAPAPAGVVPIPHLPESVGLGDADVGSMVEYSGFGLTENGTEGEKLRIDGIIDSICSGPSYCNDGLVVPASFYYLMTDGGPCTGDSGGPTFLERGGVEMTVGVTSYGDEDCTDYGVNTSVSAYAPWIEDFMAAGGIETCDNQIDDDANGAIDCDDSKCDDDTACGAGNGGGGDSDGGFCSAGGTPNSDRMLSWLMLLVSLVWVLRRRGPHSADRS